MASKYSVTLTASDKTKAAFDSAKRNASDLDSSFAKLRVGVNAVGTALVATAAASAAAFGVFTKRTVELAAEIDRFSAISNANAEEFQRQAAGARLLGVESDKLSDIYKDVNDKVGDFLQTGGGPLADFFENIAPQIGVTAEEFRNLSGPEALQLYVSSLEKANVSQNEMTFFMEAIANDATLLLPLLRDNGEGFKLLGDSAAAAGAIMSNETLQAARELNAVMFLLDQSNEGLKNTIRQQTLPVMADLAIEFSDLATNTAFADGVANIFSGTLKTLAASAVGAFAALQLAGKGIGAIGAAARTADKDDSFLTDFLISPLLAFGKLGKDVKDNADEVNNVLEIAGDDLRKTVMEYGDTLNGIWDSGNGENRQINDERIQGVVNLLSKMREELGRGGSIGSSALTEAQEEADKALTSLERLKGQLEQQVSTFGQGETAILKYRLTLGDLSDEVDKLGASGEYLVDAILKESEALDRLKEAQEAEQEAQRRSNELKQQAAQITESVLTPMEQYLKKLEEIDDLLDESALSEEIAVRAREKAHKDYEDAKNELDEMTEFVKEAARNMQDAMADGFFDIMQGEFDNFGDSFKRTIDRMVSDLLASQLLNFLMGDFGETGQVGGFIGDLIGNFGGGRALGGPVTAGVPYLVNENTPRSEIFVPNQSGTIMPAEKMGNSITISPTYHITSNNPQAVRQTIDQSHQQLARQLQHAQRNM